MTVKYAGSCSEHNKSEHHFKLRYIMIWVIVLVDIYDHAVPWILVWSSIEPQIPGNDCGRNVGCLVKEHDWETLTVFFCLFFFSQENKTSKTCGSLSLNLSYIISFPIKQNHNNTSPPKRLPVSELRVWTNKTTAAKAVKQTLKQSCIAK